MNRPLAFTIRYLNARVIGGTVPSKDATPSGGERGRKRKLCREIKTENVSAVAPWMVCWVKGPPVSHYRHKRPDGSRSDL